MAIYNICANLPSLRWSLASSSIFFWTEHPHFFLKSKDNYVILVQKQNYWEKRSIFFPVHTQSLSHSLLSRFTLFSWHYECWGRWLTVGNCRWESDLVFVMDVKKKKKKKYSTLTNCFKLQNIFVNDFK